MRRTWKDGDKWLGGYVRVRRSTPTFIIERRLAGKRWHFSTRCNTETAALKALEQFQTNPHAYARLAFGGRVVLSRELILRFTAWQLDGADAVTPKHAHYVGRYLLDWMEALGQRDVRSFDLLELKQTLKRWRGAHALRIAALKVFFAWLREEEGALRHAEDVTLDWPVPQAVPAQRRKKKALDTATVLRIVPHLSQDDAEAVMFLLATGWHLSELSRFARGGEILPPSAPGQVCVLAVRHKLNERALTPLTTQAQAELAQRIRERGRLAPYAFSRRFGDASERAGLPRVTAGVFRHTFATNARDAGADVKLIAAFLNHKDPRTTRGFYIDMGIAPAVVPVVHLSLPALPAKTGE